MAKTTKKATSRKSHSSTHKAQHKTTRAKKTSHPGKSKAPGHRTGQGSANHGTANETYIFECTRLGCGYKIVREEKFEIGQTRFDLKCPKCHNTEFKCQGRGDLPESIEMSLPIPPIDFDRINPVDLGSN